MILSLACDYYASLQPASKLPAIHGERRVPQENALPSGEAATGGGKGERLPPFTRPSHQCLLSRAALV